MKLRANVRPPEIFPRDITIIMIIINYLNIDCYYNGTI